MHVCGLVWQLHRELPRVTREWMRERGSPFRCIQVYRCVAWTMAPQLAGRSLNRDWPWKLCDATMFGLRSAYFPDASELWMRGIHLVLSQWHNSSALLALNYTNKSSMAELSVWIDSEEKINGENGRTGNEKNKVCKYVWNAVVSHFKTQHNTNEQTTCLYNSSV